MGFIEICSTQEFISLVMVRLQNAWQQKHQQLLVTKKGLNLLTTATYVVKEHMALTLTIYCTVVEDIFLCVSLLQSQDKNSNDNYNNKNEQETTNSYSNTNANVSVLIITDRSRRRD